MNNWKNYLRYDTISLGPNLDSPNSLSTKMIGTSFTAYFFSNARTMICQQKWHKNIKHEHTAQSSN